jgi:2-polyprenyl-3-methyl-5-hydroxy-6-metoxy-1,4-benzoquinol methylase
MEKINIETCPGCGNNNFKLYRISKHKIEKSIDVVFSSSSDSELTQQLVICKKCNLLFVNPRIQDNLIISGYTNGTDEKFIEQNELRIKTFKNSLLDITNQLKITNFNKLELLDIGSAGGAYLKAAKDLGFNIIGIEPNQWLCEMSKKNYSINVLQGVLKKNSFNENSFDIISLWDVIEHLTDPNEVLQIIGKILKKDGILIINYPDYSSKIAKLLGSLWPFWLDVHLFYFTNSTIKNLLTKNNFTISSISRHYQYLELGYILMRIEAKIPIIKPILYLAKIFKISKVPIKYYLGQKRVLAFNLK